MLVLAPKGDPLGARRSLGKPLPQMYHDCVNVRLLCTEKKSNCMKVNDASFE